MQMAEAISTIENDETCQENEKKENIMENKDIKSEKEIWIPLGAKSCEKYKCSKCDHKSSYHPNYSKYQAIGCVKCEGLETVCKRLLQSRNYELKSIEVYKNTHKIKFECENNHTDIKQWPEIRKGKGCTECNSTRKPKKEKHIKEVPICTCNCKETGKALYVGKSYICEHYNFAVLCPEGIRRWVFDLNKELNPYKLAPQSNKKAYFKCDTCKETYDSQIYYVFNGSSCPYCTSQRVCLGNSLQTKYPEIAKLWHPTKNALKPSEVSPRSGQTVWWVCDDKNCNHEYERRIFVQTSYNSPGCTKCTRGGAQKIGGHEQFVKDSREVHGDKYDYPEEYKGATIHINIYCPVKSPVTDQIHGNFKQMPSHHKAGTGCPKCAYERTESIGVITITNILNKWNFIPFLHYIKEYTLEGLKYKNSLRLDFYIKENIFGNKFPLVIEFDHEQHFRDDELGWENSEITQKRDLHKDLFCIENNIHLIRIPYTNKIDENYLASLMNQCLTDKIFYRSYKHYQQEIINKTDLKNFLIETVKLPIKFNDIKCSFD